MTDKINIFRHSLLVHKNIDKVKEIVLSKQFRNLFLLKRKIQNEETPLKLRTARSVDWQYIIEVKETEKKNEAIINFCFYDEGSYNLKTIEETDDSYDYALNKIDHIIKYFLRHYKIKVESTSEENAESLVTFVLDDFLGKLAKIQEMTTRKKISLFVAGISIVAGIGLIVFNNLATGVATLSIAVPIIVDVLLRR